MSKKSKFKLLSTETGRFSSKQPNVETIPRSKFTHTGNLIGGMMTKTVVATVALFKSEGCWVDPKGTRYSVKDGYQVDSDWGLTRLDLSTVTKIEE